MTAPLVFRVAQVDAALARHATLMRAARLAGRPFALSVHWPRVNALLDLRAELMCEMGQETHTTPPRAENAPKVAPAPTRGLYGGSGGAQ